MKREEYIQKQIDLSVAMLKDKSKLNVNEVKRLLLKAIDDAWYEGYGEGNEAGWDSGYSQGLRKGEILGREDLEDELGIGPKRKSEEIEDDDIQENYLYYP